MAKRKLTDLQKLGICHFVGIVIISVYGTQVSEMMEMFTTNPIGKLFLPINRSIWEESKMLVVPLSIMFAVEYFIVGKNFKNFIPAHTIIAFTLPIVMILFNFGYGIFFGNLSMQGAQAVYFLTLVLAALLASILFVTSDKDMTKYFMPFIILYVILCISYIVFSFIPPKISIFYDVINEVFGPVY